MAEEHDNNSIHPKSDLEERINLFSGNNLLFDEDKVIIIFLTILIKRLYIAKKRSP